MWLRDQCVLSKDWCLPGKTSRVKIVWLRSPESLGHHYCADTDVVLLQKCAAETHCWTIANASAPRPATLTKHCFVSKLSMRRCMAMLIDVATAVRAVPLTHRPHKSHRGA